MQQSFSMVQLLDRIIFSVDKRLNLKDEKEKINIRRC